MEATRYRNIKSGDQFDGLFGKAPGKDHTIKRSADLKDTMLFIPKVVNKTLKHTVGIANRLRGDSIPETCSNIWHFVYNHIRYKKDDKGYEQVRSPRRTWHDRLTGVDCDCYSVFISSILNNLQIPHILRITKYKQDHFQHIYPIVPYRGRYITLDCVTDQYDYEVPFSAKKDYTMELQYLDGLDDTWENNPSSSLQGSSLGFFGRRKKKKAAEAAAAAAAAAAADPNAPPPPPKKKKRGFFRNLSLRKVLNVVNKINPATVLLRNGLLVAMKLNISNVAKRIRWGYLTPQQAAAKNIDPARHQKLVATKDKLEKIFEGAGGKPSNLRKAILNGKGNKDKAVQGLDGLDRVNDFDFSGLDDIDAYTPLPELLGQDIYYSENMEGLGGTDLIDGLGELGEPVSMATIGAAMGIIKTIVASLKQIGNIFKGNSEGSADFDEATNIAAENNQPVVDTTTLPPIATQPVIAPSSYNSANTGTSVPAQYQSSIIPSGNTQADMQDEQDYTSVAVPLPSQNMIVPGNPLPPADPAKESFWDKNKKWLKPTGFVVGGLMLVAIGYKLINKKKSGHSTNGLSGTPKRKNHHRKKKAVALI